MGRKKGFGVVQCMGCGRFLQGDPVYYLIVKKTRLVGFRERRHKTIGALCVLCGKKEKFIGERDG